VRGIPEGVAEAGDDGRGRTDSKEAPHDRRAQAAGDRTCSEAPPHDRRTQAGRCRPLAETKSGDRRAAAHEEARVTAMTSGAGPRARLAALVVFALAMGWLEGVVVVYLRGLLGITHGAVYPPQAEVMARFRSLPWLMPTEQTREAATIAMLAAVGWLAARGWRARFGAFLVAFGVWDVAYYAALYALLRWPPSLGTRDVLFLIPPGPWWYQPVWLPIAISAAMIAAGARLVLRGEAAKG
jgi:hypothetical protein